MIQNLRMKNCQKCTTCFCSLVARIHAHLLFFAEAYSAASLARTPSADLNNRLYLHIREINRIYMPVYVQRTIILCQRCHRQVTRSWAQLHNPNNQREHPHRPSCHARYTPMNQWLWLYLTFWWQFSVKKKKMVGSGSELLIRIHEINSDLNQSGSTRLHQPILKNIKNTGIRFLEMFLVRTKRSLFAF